MQNVGKQVLSQLLPWLDKITPVRLIKIIVIGVAANGRNWVASGPAALRPNADIYSLNAR